MNRLLQPSRQRGLSLIELMIAMTIGVFLAGGAIAVFVSASATQRTNESIARMQEYGRYAMDVVKRDLRMAGFWGMSMSTFSMSGHKGSSDPLDEMTGDCASLWYIDLARPIEAYNGNNPFSSDCLDGTNRYLAGTDILVVRRAATETETSLTPGQVYVRSDYGQAAVFEAPDTPAGFTSTAEDRRLVTHLYYVRPYTYSEGDGAPSLRRLTLTVQASKPVLVDEEVIPDIEDLQVQFGVDDDADGSINRYVDPESSVLASADILAVRIWVMARADAPEPGYTDSSSYAYADQAVTPDTASAKYRRLLSSSTIDLRNLHTAPPAP